MPLTGDYEPSPSEWVRDQVEEYERTGGRRGNALRDTGMPIIIVWARGRTSGKIHKWGLMRVEHNGDYALVASKGGAPENPEWYANVMANPGDITIQDGPKPFDYDVRELSGEERQEWWLRAVLAYPPYAEYQDKAEREIPVLLATRRT